jgi:hypothetical protein
MAQLALARPERESVRELCRLCGSDVRPLQPLVVLDKYSTTLSHCGHCDLIQTGRPVWLAEAYTTAIAALDTGALARNQQSAHVTLSVAWLLGIAPGQPCLDFGGGHGVFVRMMRDLGLDFRWSDKYGKNLFAAGFEGDAADCYALVTAFEVFEHFDDVGTELRRLFSPRHGAVLVSTLLHDRPSLDWWYWCPETGQHLAFYSRRTMAHIAHEFGYDVIATPELTLFLRTGLELSPWRRYWIEQTLIKPQLSWRVISRLARSFGRYAPKTQGDMRAVADRSHRH